MPFGKTQLRRGMLAVLMPLLAWIAVGSLPVEGQVISTNTRSVGGVYFDTEGVISNASRQARDELRQLRTEMLGTTPAALQRNAALRKVSLRGLESALAAAVAEGKPLPVELQVLGGLQQIRYVLVYPEQQDVVLVGPGEGWRVAEDGALVGATTGRPILLLDDLMVALRAVAAPRPEVISCSIDPTPEGLQRLRTFAARLTNIGNPQQTAAGIEQQLGPQRISVTGVPGTSHFAQVMVAADYRMKRISMNLEPAPVADLPSFMQMVKATGRGMQNMLPRWWLTTDYAPLLRDAEGLAWELRPGVKAMAENDFLDAAGVKHQTGQADAVSQRWADAMTARYDALAQVEPVFGELRNCMDLAVVSALLVRQNLLGKAGLELPTLLGSEQLQPAVLAAPRQVASEATLVHQSRKWVIACGGVQINPWQIAERSEVSDQPTAVRAAATPGANWCWD